MADLRLIPDFEKLVADYLRGHDAIIALGARVVSKPPDGSARDTCWVQYRNLDESPNEQDSADHLQGVLMQFDCYAGEGDGGDEGGGRPEATLLARTVRALLHDIASYKVAGAVFTGARITGDTRIPDDSPGFEPARERKIITALVFGHA